MATSSLSTYAIVLDQRKITTTDSYVTLFTKSRGIIDVYARGANNPKNPLNKGIAPFVFGIYVLTGKNSMSMREVELIETFFDLRKDYELYQQFTFLSKLTRKIIPQNISQQTIFEQLVNCYYMMYRHTKFAQRCMTYYEYICVRELGFLPDTTNYEGLRLQIDGSFAPSKKGPLASELARVKTMAIPTFLKENVDIDSLAFWNAYIGYHFDVDMKNIKYDILGK